MKILVGLSGGVDSAAAALTLMKKGHDVSGAVLVMHDFCDVDGAREVAQSLGIALHVVDLRESFAQEVKRYFADEYAHGRTPNPCIICNERIKFAGLLSFADENGFDMIATGHYARVLRLGDRFTLGRAADTKKDQTYMLYRLPQNVLSRLVLPLSDMTKEQSRGLLRDAGFDFSDKPDSQEICFLPDGNYAEFVEEIYGKFPCGSFVSEDGRVLGEHRGIINYTVGQRKGLGIALGERMFVTAIDPDKNTVTLAPEMSGKREICIVNAVYSGLCEDAFDELHVLIKVRYTAPLVQASATRLSDGKILLKTYDSVKAAPGQSAVAYNADGSVLFGGIIV
ncbi:MAG: tRNA 2-thiouridine(34) synthase MnmA [Clostridia bacterium]|nr:tRNA 2-thiouridine(34) synthase MnmA [Clostridia bacterium]